MISLALSGSEYFAHSLLLSGFVWFCLVLSGFVSFCLVLSCPRPHTRLCRSLVDIIVPSLIRQGPGSGIEAVDLLLEVNGVERLAGYMSSVFPAKLSSDSMADDDKTDESFLRLAPYLLKSSMFEPDESEREKICLAAGNIVEREREWVLALRIVLMRGWNGSLQGDGLNAAITGVVASVDNELDENDSNQIYKQVSNFSEMTCVSHVCVSHVCVSHI